MDKIDRVSDNGDIQEPEDLRQQTRHDYGQDDAYEQPVVITALAGLLFLVPAVLLPLLWLMPLYMAWISRALPALQNQSLTFAADGVEVESGAGQGILRWAAVTRFAETKKFLLLFISSQCACAIPKVAVGDAAAARHLADFITEQLSTADGAPPTPSPDPEDVLLVAEFTPDLREVYHAVMAASRHGPALWPAYLLMLAVVGWTTIVPLWRRWQLGDLANASIYVTLLGLFPLILILSIRPLASLWAAHRHVKTNRSAAGVQRIAIAERGLQISGPYSSGFFEWSVLFKVAEVERFFLFFLTKAQPVFLPKRALEARAVDTIRALARRRVPHNRLALPAGDV